MTMFVISMKNGDIVLGVSVCVSVGVYVCVCVFVFVCLCFRIFVVSITQESLDGLP